MSDVRRTVLAALAERSSSSGETTTVSALAKDLNLPQPSVEHHVEGLLRCDMAREADGGVRVTVTAEELLELDLDGPVVIDASE